MNKKTLIFFAFFVLSHFSWGQGISTSDGNNFENRVKGYTDFVDRFNGKADNKGNLLKEALKEPEREKAIAQLFNRTAKINGTDASAFAKQVIKDKSKLSFYDKDYFVEVEYAVRYKGKSEKLSVYYYNQIEKDGKSSSWVIQNVKANFLELGKVDTARFIPPNADESGFLMIYDLAESLNYLPSYASKDFKTDQLSLFFYLLRNQELSIEKALQQKYHLLQIEGWVAVLQETKENTENSGWLIITLNKLKTTDKSIYLKHHLNF